MTNLCDAAKLLRPPLLLLLTAVALLPCSCVAQTATAVTGLSSWLQDTADDTDWTVMKSNLSTAYYYVDATTRSGAARLLSPPLGGKGSACLTLSYFLSGGADDVLSVGSVAMSAGNSSRTVVLQRAANTSIAADWIVDVEAEVTGGAQLFIEGKTAAGGSGYIAVDSVKYVESSCRVAKDERRVACNATHMAVHIPGDDARKQFYFYNSACRLSFGGSSHDAAVALDTCGVKSRVDAANGTTVYYAHLIEVADDDEIFDSDDLPVLVECVYRAREVSTGDVSFDAVASPSKINQQLVGQPPSNVTGVALLQYTSSDFRTPVARDQYPLQVKLGASMYFRLAAVGGDTTAIQVGVRTCRAYSQDGTKEHYLIKNGCVLNKSLKFLTADSESEKRFTVKSFSLLGSEGPVLMECEAVVCDKGYGACSPCVTARRRRSARARELVSHVVSLGPVLATA